MPLINLIKTEITRAQSDKKQAHEQQNAWEAVEAEHAEKTLQLLLLKAVENGIIKPE